MHKQLKYGETSQVWLLRLARKHAGEWKRPVHETWSVSGSVGKLEHPLDHKPHESIAAFMNKINLYTSLEAHYRKRQGESFSWFALLLFPLGKFFANYILAQGYRDGYPGFSMAMIMSIHSLSVRVKQYETGL